MKRAVYCKDLFSAKELTQSRICLIPRPILRKAANITGLVNVSIIL
jgi:hypothetical protein